MSWLSRNDGRTKSPSKNARWRRRNASNSVAGDVAEGEEPAQRLVQHEVEAAVQPSAVRPLEGGRLDDLADRDAVLPRPPGRGPERAPEGVRRALGVVAAEAVDAELEPASGAVDHVGARARVVAVDLRMVADAEERQVLVRPVGEREPAGLGAVAVRDGPPECRMCRTTRG